MSDEVTVLTDTWKHQYKTWERLKNNCPAAKGPGKIMCQLRGANCSFLGCVLRLLFDEVPEAMKVKELELRLSELEKKNDALTNIMREELEMQKASNSVVEAQKSD